MDSQVCKVFFHADNEDSDESTRINLRCARVRSLFSRFGSYSLRKRAYSNILETSPLNTEHFQIKNFDIFHISAENIDCGYSLEPPRRGGSNEYSQSVFLSSNKKNNVYPCKPQFYYIKVGFKGIKIIQACFRDVSFLIWRGKIVLPGFLFESKRFIRKQKFVLTDRIIF